MTLSRSDITDRAPAAKSAFCNFENKIKSCHVGIFLQPTILELELHNYIQKTISFLIGSFNHIYIS